jgi:hypothetical protein
MGGGTELAKRSTHWLVAWFERLLAGAESRRNDTLQEIERRRGRLGETLRRTSDRLVETEALLVPSIAK